MKEICYIQWRENEDTHMKYSSCNGKKVKENEEEMKKPKIYEWQYNDIFHRILKKKKKKKKKWQKRQIIRNENAKPLSEIWKWSINIEVMIPCVYIEKWCLKERRSEENVSYDSIISSQQRTSIIANVSTIMGPPSIYSSQPLTAHLLHQAAYCGIVNVEWRYTMM